MKYVPFWTNACLAAVILIFLSNAIPRVFKAQGISLGNVSPAVGRGIYAGLFVISSVMLFWLFSPVLTPLISEKNLLGESQSVKIPAETCLAFMIIFLFPLVNLFYGKMMAFPELSFELKNCSWLVLLTLLGFAVGFWESGKINITQFGGAVVGAIGLFIYYLGSKGSA